MANVNFESVLKEAVTDYVHSLPTKEMVVAATGEKISVYMEANGLAFCLDKRHFPVTDLIPVDPTT